MMAQRSEQQAFKAVCRLGPGGDYQRNWPAGATGVDLVDSAGLFGQCGIILGYIGCLFAPVLKTVGRFAGARAATQRTTSPTPARMHRLTEQADQSRASRYVVTWRNSNDPNLDAMQPAEQLPRKNDDVDTEADADTQVHRQIPRQQWLFPNDAGDSRRTSPKQSHRVRTRRSARPKAAPVTSAAQGTLFET